MKSTIKVIVFVVLFLLAASAVGQEEEKTFQWNLKLFPFLSNFVNDAEKRDINAKSILFTIDTIGIKEFKRDTLGTCEEIPDRGWNVWIHSGIMCDPVLVRRVLYHEIGHRVGMQHCHERCEHIMSSRIGFGPWSPYPMTVQDKDEYFDRMKNFLEKVE